MTARLVTLAADVDLERLQRRAMKRERMLR
jgi:hypothetical protein